MPFGQHAIIYSSIANLMTILQEEAEGKYIKRVQEETEEQRGMLVIGKFSFPIKGFIFFTFLIDLLTSFSLRNRLAMLSTAR